MYCYVSVIADPVGIKSARYAAGVVLNPNCVLLTVNMDGASQGSGYD